MIDDRLHILAFGFASPWLLWGLAAASIPVLIHLLHKRQYKETSWAAMQFLLNAARRQSRKLRIQQLLLLAVRMLIVLLLAVALARPYVENLGAYFQTDVPVHRVIILDASFSMGFMEGTQSRFDQAKDIARKILDSAKQSDAMNLMRIAGSAPYLIIRQPAYQKSQVIQELDELELTDERGDVLATLQQALELVQETPDLARKEVYILSDFQKENWLADSPARQGAVRKLLEQISAVAKLRLISQGQGASSNTSMTSFKIAEPLAIVGQPIHFLVSIQYQGEIPLANQTVELFINGRLAQTTQVDLAPNSEAQANFSYTLNAPGEFQVEARLQEDQLSLDDRRWLSLPAKDRLRVLLVNGVTSGRELDAATAYLDLALSPRLSPSDATGLIQPRVINEGDFISTDLTQYDCLFLCNIGRLTSQEVEILTAYVRGGGGLVVCLGDQVDLENYNRTLYQEGQGLLPVKIESRVDRSSDNASGFAFDSAIIEHPIMEPFLGNPNAGLESVEKNSYFKTSFPEDSTARVVLKFENGDPAIIDSDAGQGRVLVLTTAVDRSWGNWAIWPSFPPVMNECVFHVVSGRWPERQKLVGEELVRPFSVGVSEMPVMVFRPDQRSEPQQVMNSENENTIVYSNTDRAGIYEMEFGLPLNRKELFAVNVDPRESLLECMDEKELKSSLFSSVDMSYRTQFRDSGQTSLGPVSSRDGLTRWLLYLVMGFIFVEQVLAWRFSFGVIALGLLVAIGLVASLVSSGQQWAILLIGLMAAGLILGWFQQGREKRTSKR